MHSLEEHSYIIALDAMGGDHAPRSVIEGIHLVHSRYPHVRFQLYGDESQISPLLKLYPSLIPYCDIIHTDVAVAAHEKPAIALRQGRKSSMRLAIDAVSEQKAHAVISSGNTGALMAMAKIVLRTLEGIDRPAISTVIPTMRGRSVILDLGANVECSADNLFQFALMGNAFAKVITGLERPTIGLLNVGSEEMKGNDTVRQAALMLKETALPLSFFGYIEGNDIAEGTVDVVVTDGFSGNIALKTAEGTAKICRDFLKQAFTSSIKSKLGFLLVRSALKTVFGKMDHRNYNGAMLLGLNGVVVKSHGGADAVAFAHAIEVTIELVKHDINRKIISEIQLAQQLLSEPTVEDRL